MKKTAYTGAIIAAALFSGSAFAETAIVGDVLHGNGTVSTSSSTACGVLHSKPQGPESEILCGRKETGSSAFNPYERVRDDRDYRTFLLLDNIA